MTLHIRGGRVVDPSQSLDRSADLWVVEGKVETILDPGQPPPGVPDRILDASDTVVAPGLIDLHVHFREPGQTDKEDIESGTRAAVAGGFTSVFCMPNTSPPNDSPAVTEQILASVRRGAHCRVYVIGAITKGLGGKALAPLEELSKAGCVAFSDDGRPVNDARLMKEALEKTRSMNVPLIEHCEELSLSTGPTVHVGKVAQSLGVHGVPASAETVDLVRTMVLAAETGARIHLAHLSTAASVELIREFRKTVPGITAEVTPHHLMLTDEAVLSAGTGAKMYPPLRSANDRDTLRRALVEGLIDVIATDHAPHTEKEKSLPFSDAPNGIIGLETALPLMLTLVHSGELTLLQLLDRMSTTPAKIGGVDGGSLKKGAPADIVIFSANEKRTVTETDLRSKSRNTPFLGHVVRGRVRHTFVGGREAFSGEKG